MIINFRSDGHIHTFLCKHATGDMEEYVRQGIAKGLQEICFLEHMEEEIHSSRPTWLSDQEFDIYFREGTKLQQKYQDKLSIGLGVEVGYNPVAANALINRINKRKWDRVGISYHFHKLPPYRDHLNLVSARDKRVLQLSVLEVQEIEHLYFSHLIDAVNALPGTHLCHIDAPFRFHPLRNEIEQPFGLIEKLLDQMKEKDMTLEINTSGFPIRKEQFPSFKILKIALKKKVKLSLGSDAHKPSVVGNHFEKIRDLLTPHIHP